MTETTLHFIDKSTYPPGPWMDEPDKVVWIDPETGLDCMARRNSLGIWCGYVGVPENHPAYGKPYSEYHDWDETPTIDSIQQKINNLEVHGGLTFASPCEEDDKETGICHKSDREVYWFGFDCGHAYDYMPGKLSDVDMNTVPYHMRAELERMLPCKSFETYRDLNYVKSEILSLAKQLSEVKDGK